VEYLWSCFGVFRGKRLSTQWLNRSDDVSTRVAAAAGPFMASLAQPAQLRRIRLVLSILLVLWALAALVQLVWAFVPQPEQQAATPAVINPVSQESAGAGSRQVDIEAMQAWHLFGEAGASSPVPIAETPVASERDGIERGARETRLNLKLRGIVASSDDGLGHAVIEYKSKQAIYAVEDKLPVSGRVTLAKVMPRQIILDNGGTYERLELFDNSELSVAVPTPVRQPIPDKSSKAIDKRDDVATSSLASEFHEQLYTDPQSLAQVVTISAVRTDGQQSGFRVSPGSDAQKFEQLGFKSGDIVTGVNGIDLNSPGNTVKLYSALRSAQEITFELKRNNEPITLTVSLDGAGR
jgi:general secretion pathway protein C